jgi:hypothetical protein
MNNNRNLTEMQKSNIILLAIIVLILTTFITL